MPERPNGDVRKIGKVPAYGASPADRGFESLRFQLTDEIPMRGQPGNLAANYRPVPGEKVVAKRQANLEGGNRMTIARAGSAMIEWVGSIDDRVCALEAKDRPPEPQPARRRLLICAGSHQHAVYYAKSSIYPDEIGFTQTIHGPCTAFATWILLELAHGRNTDSRQKSERLLKRPCTVM